VSPDSRNARSGSDWNNLVGRSCGVRRPVARHVVPIHIGLRLGMSCQCQPGVQSSPVFVGCLPHHTTASGFHEIRLLGLQSVIIRMSQLPWAPKHLRYVFPPAVSCAKMVWPAAIEADAAPRRTVEVFISIKHKRDRPLRNSPTQFTGTGRSKNAR